MTFTFTELAEFHDGTDASSYVTASYTPTANRALLAFVSASGTTAATPTGSGNGVTWTREFRATWHGSADILCVYSAFSGTSPTTGGFTFNCSGDAATGCSIHVVEIAGANTSDFIGQIVSTIGGSGGTAPSTAFSPAIASDSAVYHAFSEVQSPPPNVTAPSGYTRLVNDGHTQPGISTGVAVHAAPGAVTTVTWGSNAGATWSAVGVELLAPTGGNPIVYTLAQASETDSVLAVSLVKRQDPAEVIETGGTQPVIGYRVSDFSSSVAFTVPAGTTFLLVETVSETDTVQAVTRKKDVTVALVAETETVFPISGLTAGGVTPIDKTFITLIYRPQIAKDASRTQVLKTGHKDGIPNDGNLSKAIAKNTTTGFGGSFGDLGLTFGDPAGTFGGDRPVGIARTGRHNPALEKVGSP